MFRENDLVNAATLIKVASYPELIPSLLDGVIAVLTLVTLDSKIRRDV